MKQQEPEYVARLAALVKMKKAHRSVRSVASEVDVSGATISRIERGHAPDLETFRKLCIWLGVSADDLLGIGETEPTQMDAITAQRIRSVLDEAFQKVSESLAAGFGMKKEGQK